MTASVLTSVSLNSHLSYEILFSYDALRDAASFFNTCLKGKKVALISHPSLYDLYGNSLEKTLCELGYHVFFLPVPEGESSKSLTQVSSLLTALLEFKFERQDAIVALGGGVIGDLAAFVSSIYLRGISLVHVPTTLLSQVDSSVGGKTGVNHDLGKNLIGSFYHPKGIVMDLSTLESLSLRERRSGLAEVVKYGVISDPTLFSFLENHGATLLEGTIFSKEVVWSEIVKRSVLAKVSVVTQDEKESGLRESLNFGHTIGHGIEAAYHYGTYLHGEAVALGMKAASYMALRLNMIDLSTYQRITSLLSLLGFPLTLSSLSIESIFEPMSLDKKIKNNQMRFVLPTQIGHVVIREDVSSELVLECISHLFDQEVL